MGEASLRRRVAERLGFKVVKVGSLYSLIAPDPHECHYYLRAEDDAWACAPPLDTWEGVGLVLKWLSKEVDFKIDVSGDEEPWHISRDTGSFFTSILMTATTDDLPTAICKFLLEVSEDE